MLRSGMMRLRSRGVGEEAQHLRETANSGSSTARDNSTRLKANAMKDKIGDGKFGVKEVDGKPYL